MNYIFNLKKQRQLKYKSIEHHCDLPTSVRCEHNTEEVFFFTYATPARKQSYSDLYQDILYWIVKHDLQDACLTYAEYGILRKLSIDYYYKHSDRRFHTKQHPLANVDKERSFITEFRYGEGNEVIASWNSCKASLGGLSKKQLILCVPIIGGKSYSVAVLDDTRLPEYIINELTEKEFRAS